MKIANPARRAGAAFTTFLALALLGPLTGCQAGAPYRIGLDFGGNATVLMSKAARKDLYIRVLCVDPVHRTVVDQMAIKVPANEVFVTAPLPDSYKSQNLFIVAAYRGVGAAAAIPAMIDAAKAEAAGAAGELPSHEVELGAGVPVNIEFGTNPVSAGDSTTGTVEMSRAAPTGGQNVDLLFIDEDDLVVPISNAASVPEYKFFSKEFDIHTDVLASHANLLVIATVSGVGVTRSLELE